MFQKLIALLVGLVVFSSISIAAEFTVPAQFQVLKIDGEKYTGSFFESTTTVNLTNGKHVVLLRYNELFEDADNDDHVKVKSEPFVVIFNMQDKPLFVVAKEFADERAARQFALSPNVSLKTNNNTTHPSESLLLSQFETRQYQQVVSKHVEVISSEDNKIERSADIQTSTAKNSRALDMLLYWWSQASKEDKAAFIDKLKKPKGQK